MSDCGGQQRPIGLRLLIFVATTKLVIAKLQNIVQSQVETLQHQLVDVSRLVYFCASLFSHGLIPIYKLL